MHRFRDRAFDGSKIAIYLATPLRLNPRQRVSPGTISVKFYLDVRMAIGQGTKRRRKWPKISIAWVGRTNVTDRQTDVKNHRKCSVVKFCATWRWLVERLSSLWWQFFGIFSGPFGSKIHVWHHHGEKELTTPVAAVVWHFDVLWRNLMFSLRVFWDLL